MTEKTWLESIEANHSDSMTRQYLIGEAQRTRFGGGSLPDAFAFLGGAFVDLGFDNLGLPPEELDNVRRAFVSTGLAVAGTTCRLRNLGPGRSVVEPADGREQAILPDHWMRGVMVFGPGERYTWVGKRVRQERHGEIDLRDYEEVGDGWVLRSV